MYSLEEAYQTGFEVGFSKNIVSCPYEEGEMERAFHAGMDEGLERVQMLELVFAALSLVESESEEEMTTALERLEDSVMALNDKLQGLFEELQG